MSSTNMSKTTIGFLSLAVVGAIFGTVAFFGLSPFIKTVVQIYGTSAQGSTGFTSRQFSVYGVNLGAPGVNATSSSILNNTGDDVYITAVKVGCEGVGTSKAAYSGGGLAKLLLSVATTSTAAPAAQSAALVGGTTFTIATSSTNFTYATSTSSWGAATTTNIWAAGSYLTFTTNATNTAVCTFGVDGFTS